MARALLIEDDTSVAEGLRIALTHVGHVVDCAATGSEGLARIAGGDYDVVVLDLMLPDIDGFEVCRRLRAAGSIPIVMLTARDDDIDVVAGLEAGADDYVVKPVAGRVLDARIRAVLRRTAERTPVMSDDRPEVVRQGSLTIDRQALVVTSHDRVVTLTPTELKLLLELADAPGRVLSRQQLLSAVWDHSYLGDSRLVDSCVQRLRAKIEDDPSSPTVVQTVRGFGYRFGGP